MMNKLGVLVALLFWSCCGYAAENAAGNAKAGWYTNIVDYAYVAERAVLPVKKGVMVIDARPTARKYNGGHIPGAVSIPDSSFDKMTNMLPEDKSTLLLYYCGGVKCKLSHKSAFKAEKLGYSNIQVYAAGYPDWKKNGGMQGVSVEHIKKLIDSKASMVIVDSRPKARKYDKGHIPGAISIYDKEFEKHVGMLPEDKAMPLYFYCGGHKCKLSANSAKKAVALGYSKVYTVPSGYPAWKKAYGGAAKPVPTAQEGTAGGNITVTSFQGIMQQAPQSLLLVDVRDADEYGEGSINGAVNMPVNDMEKRMDNLATDRTVVLFCGTGGRAGEAYDMIKMFKPDVKVYFLNAEIEFNKDGSYSIKELES
jgi:rhodanese-related sulfurtransferase